MNNTYTAQIMRVEDQRGVRAVVTYADDVIWLTDDLMAEAKSDRERITGDIEVDDDLVSFGTPGEGLGRLTYRIVEHKTTGWWIAEREKTPRSPSSPLIP